MTNMPKALAPLPISQHDRLLGAAPHVASIFFPILGPAGAVLVLQQSPFGKHNAVQSLKGDLKLFAITATIIIISLSASIYSAIQVIQNGQEIDWIGMIVKSVVVWLLLALFGLVNTITSILSAVRAMNTRVAGSG